MPSLNRLCSCCAQHPEISCLGKLLCLLLLSQPGLEVYEVEETHMMIQAAAAGTRLSWEAAAHSLCSAQFANSCKFRARALLCKIGPRQPVKPVGGTGIRGNLHGIKVYGRSRFSLPKSNIKELISMNSRKNLLTTYEIQRIKGVQMMKMLWRLWRVWFVWWKKVGWHYNLKVGGHYNLICANETVPNICCCVLHLGE